MNGLRIRPMRPDEVSIAVNWADAEGWNPGLADDVCFAAADPEGFFIGELEGAPAATISCVNYGTSFAFLGFYMVREDLRGRGYGLRIWNAAIAHAGPRVIGLDGVVAQQQNYRMSGFELAYANVRYGGTVAAPDAPQAGVVALTDVPLGWCRRTTRPCSRHRAPRSCAAGSARPDISVARSCAMEGLPAGECSVRAGRAARSARWWPTTAPPPRRFCRLC
jgi:GNAT superfamily N-acetyltransferase